MTTNRKTKTKPNHEVVPTRRPDQPLDLISVVRKLGRRIGRKARDLDRVLPLEKQPRDAPFSEEAAKRFPECSVRTGQERGALEIDVNQLGCVHLLRCLVRQAQLKIILLIRLKHVKYLFNLHNMATSL